MIQRPWSCCLWMEWWERWREPWFSYEAIEDAPSEPPGSRPLWPAMPVSGRAFGSVTFVEELRFEGPKPLRLSVSNGMMSHDVKTSPEIQELYTEVKVKQSCWHSRFLHFLRLTPHAYCLLFDWFHPHHDFFFQKLALLKPMVSWRFFAVYFYFRRWFSTKL